MLVIAKNGPKIQAAKPGDTYPNGIKGSDGLPAGPHKFNFGPDGVIVQALPMSFVANNLAMHLTSPWSTEQAHRRLRLHAEVFSERRNWGSQ